MSRDEASSSSSSSSFSSSSDWYSSESCDESSTVDVPTRKRRSSSTGRRHHAGSREKEKKESSSERKTPNRPIRKVKKVCRFQPEVPRRSDKNKYYGKHGKMDYSSKPDLGPINVSQRVVRADICPIEIDQTVDWSQVGGLEHHIRALKEMVMFPLMYPELFQRFLVTPPKGVLFYGPPGTGKTLVARALANTCSKSGQKVSFFMRKGADVLSKWIGEAERQLRLLFENAKQHQPSIIFFDEIDGLAPVRSSRQDQIHSSIVSTLLALMDGLDNRGQVVVIGATNRIDHIDSGLRRPGRFDREFLFTLPNVAGRRAILEIHTKDWVPPLTDLMKNILAQKSVGYCGADLKALCTEASLRSIRRTFPQIYESDDKVLVKPESLSVTMQDFLYAMKDISPASCRTSLHHSRPLPLHLRPIMGDFLEILLRQFNKMVPTDRNEEMRETPQYDSFEDVEKVFQMMQSHCSPRYYRPRLLIMGPEGMGQVELGSALLYHLEEFPFFPLDHASLSSDLTTYSLEESLVEKVRLALRKVPSILYLPHLDGWWKLASGVLRQTLLDLLNDLDPSVPLCLIATCEKVYGPASVHDGVEFLKLFSPEQVFVIPPPRKSQMVLFWGQVAELVKLSGLEKISNSDQQRMEKSNKTCEEALKRDARGGGATKETNGNQKGGPQIKKPMQSPSKGTKRRSGRRGSKATNTHHKDQEKGEDEEKSDEDTVATDMENASGVTVEDVLSLYSHFIRVIDAHRSESNKQLLLKDLETSLHNWKPRSQRGL
eukprot:TRINITY_DN9059_c0_g4_i2.p1 TRINITY_DN9059_c0_g4~~TRINITY_DN9059_c0_g4_i2.p1  ORF type:complete len:772 (+),score=175.82 TRINITY_DN9059_c0_g4_i2:144-2459(+)